MELTRRQFLKTGAAASAITMIPDVFTRAAGALELCEQGVNLVIVQLEGGNDGINMVIPMSDGSGSNRSAYEAARSYIGINYNDLLATEIDADPLTGGQLALHPHFIGPNSNGLMSLYNSGNMAVVVGAHYPNKNLSHELSENIWYRADPTLSYTSTGWMGRTLDQLCAGQPSAVPAVDTQNELTPLFYGNSSVLSFDSVNSLNFPLSGSPQTRFTNICQEAASSGLFHVKSIGNAAYSTVTKFAAYKLTQESLATNLNDVINGTNNGGFGHGVAGTSQSSNTLAKGLRTIYALMRGGPPGTPLGCRVFRARIGDFDRHSEHGLHIPLGTGMGQKTLQQKVQSGLTFEQQERHGRLMHRVSNAIAAFWQDLKNANLHRNTVIMTFSEFGRSVNENGESDSDSGTDHSTAAPMFVIGPTAAEAAVAPGVGVRVNGGAVYGGYQDIANLDNSGDPVFVVDFRNIYGEIIDKWLGLSTPQTNTILGNGYSYSALGLIT